MTDMTKPYDGGPAFPPFHNPDSHDSGMTLRDWFAGQALASYNGASPHVADWAYKVADAMLAAREEPRHE